MTSVIIDDILPYTQVIATSGQTVFDTDWTADDDTDLLVYARDSAVNPDDTIQLVSPSNYNVTYIGAERYIRVTFLAGRTLNDVITLVRATPADRMNLYTATNFTPSMLNGDFGRIVMMIQQNELHWSQLMPRYNTNATVQPNIDTILPILPANSTWVKNGANNKIVAAQLPEEGAASKLATYVTLTDDTAKEPNSFPLSAIADGIMVNDTGNEQIIARTLAGTANQITVTNGSGISGAPTFSIANNPIIPGNAGMGIPQGTTAQRVTPGSGIGLRFNTDLGSLEYWNGAAWVQVEDSVLAQFLPLAGGTMIGNIDMGTNKVTNAAAPTLGSDYTTKNYVDNLIENVHVAANYATTANLAGYMYANGSSGVGGTLTAGSNGAFSVDGSSPALNDRILVKNQTTGLQNGVYDLTQVGDGSNPAILTRSNDYDQASDMHAGDKFAVVGGTLNGATDWMMTQTAAITIGTTSITFSEMSETGSLKQANNLSDVDSTSTSRTNLGLGTMATQNANAVAVTGGDITGITDILVEDGGTGASSQTAYAVLCGGTTSTSPFQSIASVGTAGQILTSNGAGALPTMQTPAAVGGAGIEDSLYLGGM